MTIDEFRHERIDGVYSTYDFDFTDLEADGVGIAASFTKGDVTIFILPHVLDDDIVIEARKFVAGVEVDADRWEML
jgi:hypothetical protein